MDEDMQFNLDDEFDRMYERLKAATQDFKDVHRFYMESDKALELAVCKVLANYYDPANRRALLIQRTAQELSEEIKRFEWSVSDVGLKYAAAYFAADSAVTKLMMQMMRNAGDAFSATRAGDGMDPLVGKDPLVVVNAVMEGLSDAQRKNKLLMAQGIVVGERLATAIQVAVGLLRLRQAELASYLGQAPPGEALSIRQALIEAVASEGAWTAAEYLLTEVGKVIGTTVPIANIVIGIATIAQDLRGKVHSLQTRYDRGDVDLMLDLSEEVSIEREALKDAIKLFAEVSSLANSELELKPEFRTD
jgi:hypothetical protein